MELLGTTAQHRRKNMNPVLDSALVNAESALLVTCGNRRQLSDLPDDISRVITNMAHLAEREGLNLQEIIRIAALNYEAERQQSGATGGESSDSQAT